ncbi:MAG: hypothetical protein EOO02_20490, partial [Chitinophagaceae bacterium]
MIKTTIVLPGQEMRRFVRAYEVRHINSGAVLIRKPVHAYHETFITFLINSPNPGGEGVGTEPLFYDPSDYTRPLAGIMGVQTYMRGHFLFRGNYDILTIHFHPAGFHELFAINASLLTDRLYNAYDFVGRGLPQLHHQLNNCTSDPDMLQCAENYLLQILQDDINIIANRWNELPELVEAASLNTSVEQLASMTNMTVKSFERKFTMYVGVRPKMFAQICRFN